MFQSRVRISCSYLISSDLSSGHNYSQSPDAHLFTSIIEAQTGFLTNGEFVGVVKLCSSGSNGVDPDIRGVEDTISDSACGKNVGSNYKSNETSISLICAKFNKLEAHLILNCISHYD